eukprot:c9651_g1_i3.p1 GENE.c9651_g1_i3~~c9651_g1_i3.p1  ORF type:complete len:603 (+),score=169.61 c9651_g1_i3:821-2629(+)
MRIRSIHNCRAPFCTLATDTHRVAVITQRLSKLAKSATAKIAVMCGDVVELLRGDRKSKHWERQLQKALRIACSAITIARKEFPDPREFPDFWVCNILLALVLREMGDLDNGRIFYQDAWKLALMAGNLKGQEVCEKILKQVPSLSTPPHERADVQINTTVTPEDLVVFPMGLDNTNVTSLSIPEHVMLKAMLHRALLTSDRVAVPPQIVLNSRKFVMELLVENGHLREEYLALIRPMLPHSAKLPSGEMLQLKTSEHPLLEYRVKYMVENPGYLHEDIPLSIIEQIDGFYHKHPQLLFWFTLDGIATAYGRRTASLLELENTPHLFPKLEHELRQVLPSMSQFVKMCTADNQALTRTQMYQYSNLFPEKPCSAENFQEIFKDKLGKLSEEDRQKILEGRNLVYNQPWLYGTVSKELSDAAYTTNLPLAYNLSLVLNADQELHFQLVAPCLSLEQNPKRLTIHSSCASFAATEFAQLDVNDVIALRGSQSGQQFFSALHSRETPHVVRSRAVAFAKILETHLVSPQNRKLPAPTNWLTSLLCGVKHSKHSTTEKQPLATVEALPEDVLDSLVVMVTKTRGIVPMYVIPSLTFPGAAVMSRVN